LEKTQLAGQAISDARLSLIAALAVARCINANAIADHDDFERLTDFVREAARAMQRLDQASQTSTATIYPNMESAREALAKLPQDNEFTYRIARDGVGRCSIEIYRLTARL
jgi:hypothetical protein